MLLALLVPLSKYLFIFNVFRYITFRAVMASIFAFFVQRCGGTENHCTAK